jgi:hypothetical protein
VNGDAPIEFRDERMQDKLHSCELLGGPADAEPILALRFNTSSYGLLEPSDFGFSLWISGPAGTTWNERRPSTALQVSIRGRIFFGMHQSDPAFRLHVTVEPDGRHGTLNASHLLDPTTGETIDLNGLWHCSPDLPDERPKAAVAAAELVASATNSGTTPEPPLRGRRHFRAYHASPCEGADCAIWTVTDVHSGETFTTSIKLKTRTLSPSILRQVQNGQVELWITGSRKTNASGKPILTAWRLEKVVPRQASAER